MNEPTKAREAATEQPIVVHAPMTGDADRVASALRSAPIAERWTEPATATSTQIAPTAYVSVAPTKQRVFGLDALRGILLLAMNFTFTIPPAGPFAKWMYHTQVPPSPTREYVNVAGLTWQDMLFALFVFTMAAAIPVAMNPRLEKGKPYPDILWLAVRRAAMLLVFALVIAHVNPYWTNDYTRRGNVVALLGFVVSFAVFVQPGQTWRPVVTRWLRTLGWIGVAFILLGMPALYGQNVSAERRDYIMAALAFCTLAGTAVWLLTRRNVAVRMLLFGAILAAKLLAPHVLWIGALWTFSPIPWFYQPWYLELMLLVIPGTVVGDLVWRWMRRDRTEDASPVSWTRGRMTALAMLAASFPVILNVGLYERRYPLATTAAVVAIAALMLAITRGAATTRDRVLSGLTGWSAALLVAGMLLEPLEGGIKKDPQTVGFLLLMAGTAVAGLQALLIVADSFRSRVTRPLAVIGQNALFAYVIVMLCIEHLLWLTGIGAAFTDTWQAATLRSVSLTFLAGMIVWLATRKGLIWKA